MDNKSFKSSTFGDTIEITDSESIEKDLDHFLNNFITKAKDLIKKENREEIKE